LPKICFVFVWPFFPSYPQRDVPGCMPRLLAAKHMAVAFTSAVHSCENSLLKVCNTSECLHCYHWTVLFDLLNSVLYVRHSEHYSLDLKAETAYISPSVGCSCTDTATSIVTFLLSYANINVLFKLSTVEKVKHGSLSLWSSTFDQIWWWGSWLSCRVNLILLHTNRLQTGLASNVASCHLDGQGFIPVTPHYSLPLPPCPSLPHLNSLCGALNLLFK
jgi:hypothetical protein